MTITRDTVNFQKAANHFKIVGTLRATQEQVTYRGKGKSKAVPLQTWTGSEGS